MEIIIIYNAIDWLFVIDDYDYVPEQKESGPTYDSGGEPGFPEAIEINEYHLEIDAPEMSSELTMMITDQLNESDVLCNHLFNKYEKDIHEEALEQHHDL